MADKTPAPKDTIDRDDSTRHAEKGAVDAAREKMQAAIEDDSKEEIVKDQATLESDVKDRSTSSKDKTKKTAIDTSLLSNVKVYSPYHVYFDGEANSVSAENLTGPFDVLPGHKNFMSLLTPSDIVIRSDRGEETIKSDRAVMHVRENKVTIFLDV